MKLKRDFILYSNPSKSPPRERNNGKEFQVPFVDAFIKKVDISNHKIIINVIEGML